MILYHSPLSGHPHRPKAFLSILGVEHDTVNVNFAKGEHRSEEFLMMNLLGQVPVLQDGAAVLRDSTAILTYLALKYDTARTWLPSDPAQAALVQSWLATSVKEVFEGPCAARLIKFFGAPMDLNSAKEKSDMVLGTLFEPHLANRAWLVGDGPTIADIANYGYIAAAPQADISLDAYPNITAWLRQVEAIDGFEPMPRVADILG